MSKFDDHIDLMRDLAKNAENMDPHWTYSRRNFLKSGVAAAAMVGMPFALGSKAAHAARLPYSPDYGPLMPVNDEVTGLPLLQLPEGFKYWSYGWTGDLMNDGVATPGAHDGMAVVAADANRIVLVRNHEQGSSTSGHYMPGSKGIYDPRCNGGTTTLVFAPQQKKWLSSWASLSGLIRPCAGGPTPWNTWISSEETSVGPMTNVNALKQHGYNFEVPASGISNAVPLVDMGCFSHEAVAVDPRPPEAGAGQQQRRRADGVARPQRAPRRGGAVEADHPQPPRAHAERLPAAAPADRRVRAAERPAREPQQHLHRTERRDVVAGVVPGEEIAQREQRRGQQPQRDHRHQVVQQRQQAPAHQCARRVRRVVRCHRKSIAAKLGR